jgi:hypothetical protein
MVFLCAAFVPLVLVSHAIAVRHACCHQGIQQVSYRELIQAALLLQITWLTVDAILRLRPLPCTDYMPNGDELCTHLLNACSSCHMMLSRIEAHVTWPGLFTYGAVSSARAANACKVTNSS